jgi:hypothetical protein
MFAQAIDALVAERDRAFIERIANDYNLPLEELKAKYLETTEVAIKVPRKYKKREPKAVLVVTEGAAPAPAPKAKVEKKTCEALTSKKEPCKFSALKGECFCKRHLKASQEEAAGEPKPPKVKKAAKKAEQPVHSHELTEEIHEDCDLCQSHGNPLSEAAEFEVVKEEPKPVAKKPIKVAPKPAARVIPAFEEDEEEPKEVSVKARLAAMLEEAEYSDEEDFSDEDDEAVYEDE